MYAVRDISKADMPTSDAAKHDRIATPIWSTGSLMGTGLAGLMSTLEEFVRCLSANATEAKHLYYIPLDSSGHVTDQGLRHLKLVDCQYKPKDVHSKSPVIWHDLMSILAVELASTKDRRHQVRQRCAEVC